MGSWFFSRLKRRPSLCFFFFFNDTATTEIYTLSLHDALPIFHAAEADLAHGTHHGAALVDRHAVDDAAHARPQLLQRSEEHTSELQSPCNLVCRLLLEKKNNEHIQLRLRTSPRLCYD